MLNNEASREALKKAKRIVIKVGTSTITYANGKRNFSQIDRLAREIHAIVAKPEVREVFAQQGVEPETSTPAEFQRLIDEELTRWAKDVKTLGIL